MMPVMARRAPTPVSLHDPIFLKFRWLVLSRSSPQDRLRSATMDGPADGRSAGWITYTIFRTFRIDGFF